MLSKGFDPYSKILLTTYFMYISMCGVLSLSLLFRLRVCVCMCVVVVVVVVVLDSFQSSEKESNTKP